MTYTTILRDNFLKRWLLCTQNPFALALMSTQLFYYNTLTLSIAFNKQLPGMSRGSRVRKNYRKTMRYFFYYFCTLTHYVRLIGIVLERQFQRDSRNVHGANVTNAIFTLSNLSGLLCQVVLS